MGVDKFIPLRFGLCWWMYILSQILISNSLEMCRTVKFSLQELCWALTTILPNPTFIRRCKPKTSTNRLTLMLSKTCDFSWFGFLEDLCHKWLILRFLHFKLHSKNLRGEGAYKAYQKKLINNWITEKLEAKKDRVLALQNQDNHHNLLFSMLDFNHVFSFICGCNQKKEESYERKHSRKLHSLGLAYHYKLQKPEDVIFNFSEHKLTED